MHVMVFLRLKVHLCCMYRLGLSIFVGGLFFISCQSDSQIIKAEKRDWTESIYASSKVQSVNQYAHYAEVNGRLLRYLVSEGDTVNAGDLIAEIDGVNSETRVNIAQSQLEAVQSGKARIQELGYQIQSAQNVFTQDYVDYFRQKRLFESGIGSKAQLEIRKLKFLQSKSQTASLKSRYTSLSEEINAQRKQAEQNVALTKNQLHSYYIYANRKGRIYELRANVGELVSPQQPIALIGDAHDFLVEMEIDERDISKIQLNQEVIVKLDAYNETFKAYVSKISPHLDAQTQTFHAEAVFTGTHPLFYPGLTAESNIILQQKKQVWVLPVNALENDSAIKTSQGIKNISMGLRNTQFVEITQGVDETTEIILPNE